MGRKQLDEAKTLYDKALEEFMGIGDQDGIAAVYANLGMVYEEGEELQQAASSYQRSAEAYEAMGNQAQAEMVKELLRKVRGDQKRK